MRLCKFSVVFCRCSWEGILGIGDDIRPRAFKRLSKNTSKPAKKAEKRKEEITKDLFSQPNDDDFFADTPIEKNGKNHKDYQPETKKPNSGAKEHSYRWLYTLIIILVIIILAGLVAWQNLDFIKNLVNGSYKKQNDQNLSEIISSTSDSLKNVDSSSQSQTAEPAPAEQSTATPAINKSAISLSVLNGSGVKSSAKNVADQLTTAGFAVSFTGNANKFNYQQTFIYFKTGKEAEANLVKDSLTGRVTEVKESNAVVGTKYDVVVVVGKT